ncbi:hypothetical protein CLG85_013435 [Yangia mangrovi]|uniref:Uncharacterized protein n=1 Tax=Alloyangia mangrovi TaxID=1779329 RepID=A0ABT2KP75_9RHOB|nr:hypothetical protein [Alloyangia mangrovi]MCT4371263.1 hypothetical protein [Alloyangia mangrovi]
MIRPVTDLLAPICGIPLGPDGTICALPGAMAPDVLRPGLPEAHKIAQKD